MIPYDTGEEFVVSNLGAALFLYVFFSVSVRNRLGREGKIPFESPQAGWQRCSEMGFW